MRMFSLALSIMVVPLNALAQDCASVIALSRERSSVVASASEVQSNVTQFCNEYSRNRSSSDSSRFGASYKFLSATLSGQRATVDGVATRYCSESNNYLASNNAYQSYIEAIAPGAYAAYQSCIRMQDVDLRFGVEEGSVLANEFKMTVSFDKAGRETAQLTASPSTGVSCAWDISTSTTVSLRSPATATLSCKRLDATQPSVIVVAQNNGTRSLVVPWQSYRHGVPFNALQAIQAELETLTSQINRMDVQGGKIGLTASPGSRRLDDASRCVDDSGNSRGEARGRVVFPRAFPIAPIVTAGLSTLDVSGDRNLRISFNVLSVDTGGFDYSFTTWCDTQVYRASAYWTAVSR